MKAIVYTGTRQIEFLDVEDPKAGEGQTIVDVSHCGICGSDMHAYHGHDSRRIPPLVLGHEAVGIARTGRFAGKRVAINPLMTCGECEVCTDGREHLCADRELIGMRVPGAFAEAVAVNEDNLTEIPDHLSFEMAALAEPLACGVHAVRIGAEKSHLPLSKASVTVLGGGAIGLLAALVFKLAGTPSLRIAETNPLRREMLEASMDAEAYDPLDKNAAPVASDIVLDAVGSGHTRRAASEIVKPGGTIVHIGLQDSAEGLDTRRLTLQEVTFVGTYCYTPADFNEALQVLADGKIDAKNWMEIRPLSEGGQGFHDIHDGKAPPKIVLKM